MECLVDNCTGKVKSKRLCHAHYFRIRRYGSFNLPVLTDMERFLKKCVKHRSGCTIIKSKAKKKTYGLIYINKKPMLMHRWIYEQTYDCKLDSKMFVCHKCDNPRCVNPEHLFIGTNKQNMEDRHRKGRDAKGKDIGNSKLTNTKVRNIRDIYKAGGISQRKLAKKYKVSQATIQEVVTNNIWKHV